MRLRAAILLTAICVAATAQNRGGFGRGMQFGGKGQSAGHFPKFPPFKVPRIDTGFPSPPFPFNLPVSTPWGLGWGPDPFSYPWFSGGYGYPGFGFGMPGYGGYGMPSPPPNITVVVATPPAAPPAVTIVERERQSAPVVQEVFVPAPVREVPTPTEYPAIVAIRNGGIYSASTYWSRGKTFHFITTQGNHIEVASARVERVVPPQRDGRSIEPPPPPRQLRAQ